MPPIDQIFTGSNTLKAEDLMGKDWTLTIKSAEIKEFDGKMKPVLAFAETDKTFVCNKTNSISIGEVTGQFDTDGWPGHQITVYPTKTDFGGRITDCIRVRPAAGMQPAQAPVQNSGHPNAPQSGGMVHADPTDEIPF